MKLGARILKTGIAIILALYLAELLNSTRTCPFWYCCNICDSTYHLSILSVRHRTNSGKYYWCYCRHLSLFYYSETIIL